MRYAARLRSAGRSVGRHRWSTLSVRRPPKCATAIAAAISGSNPRQENTSMKHLPETSSAWMVIELVSMNCIADQPSRSPSPNRSSRRGPCARMPIASITLGTKARMELGSSSRLRRQPSRSIAASMPHGADFRLEARSGRARCIAGPRGRRVGANAMDWRDPKTIGLPPLVVAMISARGRPAGGSPSAALARGAARASGGVHARGRRSSTPAPRALADRTRARAG